MCLSVFTLENTIVNMKHNECELLKNEEFARDDRCERTKREEGSDRECGQMPDGECYLRPHTTHRQRTDRALRDSWRQANVGHFGVNDHFVSCES